MSFLLSAVSSLWLIVMVKLVLFWIYLWQLKEYHVGRFVDHFRTTKGKKLLFNYVLAVKLVLLFLLLLNTVFLYVLLLVYAAEVLLFIKNIAKRSFKKPKFTFKTAFLIFVSLVIIGVYWLAVRKFVPQNKYVITLLIFDILVPLIISAVVLFFQPFFVMLRNNTLKKATKKIAQFPNLTVIGITGSYGKTSTKEFLTTILSPKFKVLSTPDHKNSEIGIAQTILNDLKPEHQIFVVEMGSYAKGGIKLLCDMVKPKIGIVTGVNEQHLATFGSLENLLSAEGGKELVQALPKNGLIILNGDNKYCVDLYKQIYNLAGGGLRKNVYTVGRNKLNADIWTEDVEIKKDSISFIAKSKQKELAHFSANVLGAQNIQNLLGAILAAKEFDMSFEEISHACKNITEKQAGMTLSVGVHGINIVDSSYSANPDGVIADLDYLAVFPGKRVIVMPCLIELGEKSSEIHEKLGKKIAQVCDLAIITSADKFKELKTGALSAGMKEEQIILCDKPQEILVHITTVCKEGDAVLLEGGRPKELIGLLQDK